MTHHAQFIIKALKCSEDDARMIEALLSEQVPLGDMHDLEKQAERAWKTIRKDPELRRILKEELHLS